MLRITTANPASPTTRDGDIAAGDRAPTPPSVAITQERVTNTATHEPLTGNHARAIIPWITSELTFHSVLDMACGDGSAVAELVENEYDAHGIDLAPAATLPGIMTGDMFAVPQEAGYYDLVICCNTAHELSPGDVTRLFAEMDRLSNSYIMITVPSPEFSTDARKTSWWAQRAEDFGWRFRLVREDPDADQLALLIEKPDSLAARILPLLEDGELPAQAPRDDRVDGAITCAREVIDSLRIGDEQNGYDKLSTLANSLLDIGTPVKGLHTILTDIVDAMERADRATLITLLEGRLIPGLESL